ncbi:MAG: PD-(D/E)XK nuclease family protein [Crocinitomicaceae bacterium]
MNTFLAEQVQRIFDRHVDKKDLLWKEEIAIIIPNRRAAVYIQKYLANCFARPFFSPEIVTINEWINKNTDEKILTNTELLFILYDIHTEIEGKSAEPFEQFMQWGKTVLSDFDEIDRYMVQPSEIFRDLRHIKELESWDVGETPLSTAQENFKSLWDKLEDYYQRLELKLIALGATYTGKAYNRFFHQLHQKELKSHYYFLGFNAVSKVEKMIMRSLVKEGKATVVFDVDQFYLDNSAHEAGHFYREIKKEWDLKETVPALFDQHRKTFEIIETSQQTTQTKIAGNIVKELLKKGEKLNKTAIVLADESLLIPLTKSLPLEIEKANITMGWPIKFSYLKGFLDVLFEIQFNFQKFKTDQIYHKSLIQLIQHPYFSDLSKNPEAGADVQEQITESNDIFIGLDQLVETEAVFGTLSPVLTPWSKNTADRLSVFETLTQLLYQAFQEEESGHRKVDLEILYQFDKGFRRLRDMLSAYSTELSLRAFRQLFYQFWQNESVSFLGNPTDGLQVMGILETRALDFENLIILGMNEGILPKSNFANSFIPRDLRLFENQLPTEEDRQAIFAHHFYRLLQRAKKVYMTYNSTSDSWTSGEKSRFITQIENELDLSKHSISSLVYSPDDRRANTAEVVYRSNATVRKQLDTLFEKGLSPSALNKFINCPLDFYYRYILNFDEIDEIEENIESSTFGTKIHQVLEAIIEENFKKADGSFAALSIDLLQKEKNRKNIHQRLEKAYLSGENSKKFRKSDLKYGQNKLSFDVSVRFIESFLEMQIKELKHTTDAVIPIDLEKQLEGTVSIKVEGVVKQLRLHGNADRIDKIGGQYRIIDYKTGKCDKDKVGLPQKVMEEGNMEKFIYHSKKAYARQLLMYALMFRETYRDFHPFTAGIISMVQLNAWIQNVKSKEEGEEISEELLDHFKSELGAVIEKMYDPDFEFKHNPDSDYCQHCES